MDSAWEQRKLKARKLLENAAESPASSARFVGKVLKDGFEFELGTSIIAAYIGGRTGITPN